MATDEKTILLVDDDVDFVRMNKAVLEHGGYHVIVACNGAECMDKAKASKPDLILLDIMMTTVGDGMCAAQNLRREEATRGIPIIVVTSVNQTPPYNIGPDEAWMPVDLFMEKPVAPDVLLDEVRKTLGQPSTVIQRRM